jgi:hypothetical protein
MHPRSIEEITPVESVSRQLDRKRPIRGMFPAGFRPHRRHPRKLAGRGKPVRKESWLGKGKRREPLYGPRDLRSRRALFEAIGYPQILPTRQTCKPSLVESDTRSPGHRHCGKTDSRILARCHRNRPIGTRLTSATGDPGEAIARLFDADVLSDNPDLAFNYGGVSCLCCKQKPGSKSTGNHSRLTDKWIERGSACLVHQRRVLSGWPVIRPHCRVSPSSKSISSALKKPGFWCCICRDAVRI